MIRNDLWHTIYRERERDSLREFSINPENSKYYPIYLYIPSNKNIYHISSLYKQIDYITVDYIDLFIFIWVSLYRSYMILCCIHFGGVSLGFPHGQPDPLLLQGVGLAVHEALEQFAM